MPYKEGKQWRGCVTYQGKRYQAVLPTKRAAVAWESERREELKKNAKKRLRGMDLLTFCTKYLDYSTRYTPKTCDEKRSICKRILSAWGSEFLVEDITPEMVLSYLDARAKNQSNNAFNKDRKNLLAMWNWGQEILNLPTNPVVIIKKRPHDRGPQYVPPTEDVLRILAVATREEKVFLDCYLQTGARRSEIFRWTWTEDVNFEKRRCRLGTRKTRDGSMEYEWFPMTDELYDSLWWWWENREFKNSPYVFVDNHRGPNYGKPYKVRRRFLASLCERAGVKPIGFHALRRYVASVLADTHKVSAKKIQRILRHKNLSTTERYIKAVNQDLKNTLSLLSTTKIPEGHTHKRKEASLDTS